MIILPFQGSLNLKIVSAQIVEHVPHVNGHAADVPPSIVLHRWTVARLETQVQSLKIFFFPFQSTLNLKVVSLQDDLIDGATVCSGSVGASVIDGGAVPLIALKILLDVVGLILVVDLIVFEMNTKIMRKEREESTTNALLLVLLLLQMASLPCEVPIVGNN